MTKSLYVIGGAGTGKSTFTQQVLERSWQPLGPLEDLHSKPNSKGTVITLRGHPVGGEGMYLGCMREEFPGTDGLNRVSYIPGEEWLETAFLPEWIIAEGATLAVRRFLRVLNQTTDLLVVFLEAEDFVKELRFAQRGSEQPAQFVLYSATRAENLARNLEKEGIRVRTVDSSDPEDWDDAFRTAVNHLF